MYQSNRLRKGRYSQSGNLYLLTQPHPTAIQYSETSYSADL